MIARVTLANGEERIRIPVSDLAEFLGFESHTDETYRAMRRLLVEQGWLTEHRRSMSPKNGVLLPLGWDASLHREHLRRIGRNLLREAGHAEEPTVGRIAIWD